MPNQPQSVSHLHMWGQGFLIPIRL